MRSESEPSTTGTRLCTQRSTWSTSSRTLVSASSDSTTVRGVRRSPAVTRSSRSALDTQRCSSGRTAPCRAAMRDTTSISSSLGPWPCPEIPDIARFTSQTIGKTLQINAWSGTTMRGPRSSAYRTPRLFGTISVTASTSTVKTAAKTATAVLPKSSPTIAPHQAAPTVWAIVLTVRIAAIGISTSLRSRARRLRRGSVGIMRLTKAMA